LRYCRSSCRGRSFLEDSGEKSLAHQYLSNSKFTQIVEAGPHTRDEPNHIQPGRYYGCLLRPTETFTFHVAKPSPALRDRALVVPTGRAMGGGSSINCMEISSWLRFILKL
jgi:GMC oxidoreductase